MSKLQVNDVGWVNFCAMVQAVRDARRPETRKFNGSLPRPYPRKTMRTVGAYQIPR